MVELPDEAVLTPPPRAPHAIRWGAWALVAVALVQPVAAVATVVHVLSGGVDDTYLTSSTTDEAGNTTTELQPGIGFWDRWQVALYLVPFHVLLLAGTVAVVALAGVHLAGRDRWPLPRAVRLVGAGGGASTALAAAAALTLVVLDVRRQPEDGSFLSSRGLTGMVEILSTTAAVLVFAVAATAVLLGRSFPHPAGTGSPARPAHEPTASRGAEDEVPGQDHGLAEPVPEPEPVHAAPAAAMPRLSDEDRALYRRPAP